MQKHENQGHPQPAAEEINWAAERLNRVVANVSEVVFGKEEVLRFVLAAICARGHVLLEDQPGVGKTLMARAFALSLGVKVNRVQFTPDVVPSDVTGTVVFSRRQEEFTFRKGPVFTNILLADEINRGTPRTQSSLLQSMEEGAVTIERENHELPTPFFVIATQNPMEVHGTFPLPESQLDRFMFKLSLGFPAQEHEDRMLKVYCSSYPLANLASVISGADMQRIMNLVQRIYISEDIRSYILSIVGELRSDPRVKMGISPRGSLALARAAQAVSLMEQRDSVLPDDVKALAPVTLSHRLVPHSYSDDPALLVREALEHVPVPVLD